MTREELIRKFTSRKFWLTLVQFITMVYMACGGAKEEAAQMAAIIMAGASIIAYILSEGWIDNSNANGTISIDTDAAEMLTDLLLENAAENLPEKEEEPQDIG